MSHEQVNRDETFSPIHDFCRSAMHSSGIVFLTGVTPITSLLFLTASYTIERGILGHEATLTQAYLDGLCTTATVFGVSILLTVTTHPDFKTTVRDTVDSICNTISKIGFFAGINPNHRQEIDLSTEMTGPN